MSNTGTDGETIETSCLWNEKGSGQVQMIWAIQEWSFTTAATSYNVYTFNQLRSGTWSHQTPSRWSKRSHHTNTLRLPAKPGDMNYTWPCAVMCTPVDLFHPQRSVQSAADVAFCLHREWNMTQDLHPFDCSEEGSVDEKRNPTPAGVFSPTWARYSGIFLTFT